MVMVAEVPQVTRDLARTGVIVSGAVLVAGALFARGTAHAECVARTGGVFAGVVAARVALRRRRAPNPPALGVEELRGELVEFERETFERFCLDSERADDDRARVHDALDRIEADFRSVKETLGELVRREGPSPL